MESDTVKDRDTVTGRSAVIRAVARMVTVAADTIITVTDAGMTNTGPEWARFL